MQRDVSQNNSSHPSSKELAFFVDKKLDTDKRTEIVKHLIECDKCSDVVALVMKYGKKNEVSSYMNNIYYKKISKIVSGLAVASLIIFSLLPNNGGELGLIDLSKPPSFLFKGVNDMEFVNKIIDADKVLASIIKITNLSHSDNFNKAKDEERKRNFEDARGLYTQAMIEATMESDIKKSLQQKIVIHNRLLDLSLRDKNQEAIEEYKNILRYEIRLYSTKIK